MDRREMMYACSGVFPITVIIPNGTYSGDNKIKRNKTATVNLLADEDYGLPRNITVSGADFTYTTQGPVVLDDLYYKVEYIESTGTQWIDTDVSPSSNTKIRMKYMYTHAEGGAFIGNLGSSDTDDWRYFKSADTGLTYIDLPGSGTEGSRISASYVTSTSTIYETEIGNHYIKNLITGATVVSGTTTSFSTRTYHLYLTYPWTQYSSGTSAKDYGRIYYLKIYSGTTLIRDFIPVVRISDNKPGLYDQVNDVFYTNKGTGEYKVGNYITNGNYTYYDYIQATGTQYINTGFVPTSKSRLEVTLKYNEIGDEMDNGSSDASTSRFCFGAKSTWSNFYIGLGNYNYNNSDAGQHAAVNEFGPADTNKHLFVLDAKNKIVKLDNKTSSVLDFTMGTSGKSVYIGARLESDGSIGHYCKENIYDIKLYEDDVLKKHLIPVKRTSDGAIGVLNLVDNTFIKGGGTFGVGNVVVKRATVNLSNPTGKVIIDVPTVTNFLTCSWSDVINYCNQLEAGTINTTKFCAHYLNGTTAISTLNEFVGLERPLVINSKTHNARVIGTQHDTISGGTTKAAITFQLATLLSNSSGTKITQKFNESSSDPYYNIWNDGTQSCNIRNYLLNTFKGWLPSEVQSAIKTVKKKTSAGNTSTVVNELDETIFLLSKVELNNDSSATYVSEGSQYKYWSSVTSYTMKDISGSSYYYWLRSPDVSTNTNAVQVYSSGTVTTYSVTDNQCSLSPAFCI